MTHHPLPTAADAVYTEAVAFAIAHADEHLAPDFGQFKARVAGFLAERCGCAEHADRFYLLAGQAINAAQWRATHQPPYIDVDQTTATMLTVRTSTTAVQRVSIAWLMEQLSSAETN